MSLKSALQIFAFSALIIAGATASASISFVERDVKACERKESVPEIASCYEDKKIEARADAEIDAQVKRILPTLKGAPVRGNYDLKEARPMLVKRVQNFRAYRESEISYLSTIDNCSGCTLVYGRRSVDMTLEFAKTLKAE